MSDTVSMKYHQDVINSLEKEIADLKQDKNDIYEDYEELKSQYSKLVRTYNQVLSRDVKDINELREKIQNLEYDLKKKDEKSLLKDKQLEAKDKLIKLLKEESESEDAEQLQHMNTLFNEIKKLTDLVQDYRIAVGVLVVVILFQFALMVFILQEETWNIN